MQLATAQTPHHLVRDTKIETDFQLYVFLASKNLISQQQQNSVNMLKKTNLLLHYITKFHTDQQILST